MVEGYDVGSHYADSPGHSPGKSEREVGGSDRLVPEGCSELDSSHLCYQDK